MKNMKKFRYLLLSVLISTTGFSFEIPRYQDIVVKDEVVRIDMHRLLDQTQMIESRGGRDVHRGRVAKTSYQYEIQTAEHYVNLVPELKSWIEEELGKTLKFNCEEDARNIAYLIYMSKLQYHRDWLDKFDRYYRETGDVEWAVYKIYWNSIKGATTRRKWNQREAESLCML